MFFTFTPYVTPKHSTLISIRYFCTFLGLTIQLSKYFFLINSKEACLGPSYLETQTELPTIRLFVSVILDVSKNLNTWFTLLTAAFNLLKSTFLNMIPSAFSSFYFISLTTITCSSEASLMDILSSAVTNGSSESGKLSSSTP